MPDLERLAQLRRVVENAPEELFHMKTFCEQVGCQIAYCAAGWAAIDPWFQKNTEINDILEVGDDDFVLNETYIDPFFELGQMFGLNYADSKMLFGAEMTANIDPHAVTKAEVIANIDRLVSGNHAEVYEALSGYQQIVAEVYEALSGYQQIVPV